jgi:hypothetical protein
VYISIKMILIFESNKYLVPIIFGIFTKNKLQHAN